MASSENTFLCSKCQRNIPIKEKTYHELSCLYENNYNIDFTNLIPCEICDELINVEEYNDHISRCQIMIERGSVRTINSEMINTLRNRLENIIRERNTNREQNSEEEQNTEEEIQIMDQNRDDDTRDDDTREDDTRDDDTRYDIEREENEENPNEQQPITNRILPNRILPNRTLLTEAISNIVSEISSSNSQTQIIEDFRNYFNNSNVNSNIIINPFDNVIINSNNNFSQINNIVTNIINNNINEVEPPNNSYEELTQISNRVGIVSVGIDNIDDVSTPIISLKSEICPICIQKENNLRLTLCNHTFCDLCLQKWLKDNNKCPICMQNLLDLLNDKDE